MDEVITCLLMDGIMMENGNMGGSPTRVMVFSHGQTVLNMMDNLKHDVRNGHGKMKFSDGRIYKGIGKMINRLVMVLKHILMVINMKDCLEIIRDTEEVYSHWLIMMACIMMENG
eukprot:GHVU01051189.1.p1 GENE.GHVU01051189.1~~GHVU01051189.1.p1  ORF type:complete len:115 (+),score=11.52 GHVU01051189.1:472-816(+)